MKTRSKTRSPARSATLPLPSVILFGVAQLRGAPSELTILGAALCTPWAVLLWLEVPHAKVPVMAVVSVCFWAAKVFEVGSV